MKTEKQALQDVRAKFEALETAQQAVIQAAQNGLTNLIASRREAIERIRQYFKAVSDKGAADAVVANPPDEVKS